MINFGSWTLKSILLDHLLDGLFAYFIANGYCHRTLKTTFIFQRILQQQSISHFKDSKTIAPMSCSFNLITRVWKLLEPESLSSTSLLSLPSSISLEEESIPEFDHWVLAHTVYRYSTPRLCKIFLLRQTPPFSPVYPLLKGGRRWLAKPTDYFLLFPLWM